MRFIRARVTRIFPAFYTCLAVTAQALAPVGVLLSGSGQPLYSWESLSYVVKNSLLWVVQDDIAGLTGSLPHAGALNGSLWTLAWEFACYGLVFILGTFGLLRKPITWPVVFVAAWLLMLVPAMGISDSITIHSIGRFGLAFSSGAIIYVLRMKLPLSPDLLWGAAGGVLAACFLPEYILVGAPLLAYLLVGSSALMKDSRLVVRTDLSYGMYIYAFPIQQTLVLAGMTSLPVGLFAAASLAVTAPLAALSWFLVERPALRRLKGRRKRAAPTS